MSDSEAAVGSGERPGKRREAGEGEAEERAGQGVASGEWVMSVESGAGGAEAAGGAGEGGVLMEPVEPVRDRDRDRERETGVGAEPVVRAAVVGGAWDDGLIARRARDVGLPRLLGRQVGNEERVETPVVAGVASSGGSRVASGMRAYGASHAESRAAYRAEARGDRCGDDRGGAMVQPRSPAGVEGGGGGAYRWVAGGGRRAVGGGLRGRLDALRELIALSRSRLDGRALEGAGRVLETADERYRLSGEHTVVAIAGATGSGKSSLFNALAGANRSQAGPRRPTTAEPVACVWPGSRSGAEGLLHRLGVPVHRRHAPADGSSELHGLILIDLPDHDSSATEHRAQVDRMLELVDAVIWVVDPEKYADAVLHERYLRPLAGYAEVMFVVLNQVDRLPGDAADQVVDDLRRLLDEDGLALGEHGEPGAAVLALSAATGRGVGELREALGQFVAERGAADRRLAADVDAATERLRSVYAAQSRVGLTEQARAEFDDRLAEAVGAVATGRAAERDWLRYAERACGSPWARMRGWRGSRWGIRGSGAGATGAGGIGGGLTGAGRVESGRTHTGRAEVGRAGVGQTGVGRAGARRAAAWRTGMRRALAGRRGRPVICRRPVVRPVREWSRRWTAGQRHGPWWSRPSARWLPRRRTDCRRPGPRRCGRRRTGERTGCRRRWTRWRRMPRSRCGAGREGNRDGGRLPPRCRGCCPYSKPSVCCGCWARSRGRVGRRPGSPGCCPRFSARWAVRRWRGCAGWWHADRPGVTGRTPSGGCGVRRPGADGRASWSRSPPSCCAIARYGSSTRWRRAPDGGCVTGGCLLVVRDGGA